MEGFMPICKKCSQAFPCKIKIDGKEHVLSSRKYCFDCSPFGSHNTKKLDESQLKIKKEKGACACGRSLHGRLFCYVCAQKKRVKRVKQHVHGIVGTACWKCGFDEGIESVSVLDFHHMDATQKLFSLTVRNMCNRAWSGVLPEIKKCALLCCRCHRLLHNGLVPLDEIRDIYENRWRQCDFRFDTDVGDAG
jgi:hypothetical protein